MEVEEKESGGFNTTLRFRSSFIFYFFNWVCGYSPIEYTNHSWSFRSIWCPHRFISETKASCPIHRGRGPEMTIRPEDVFKRHSSHRRRHSRRCVVLIDTVRMKETLPPRDLSIKRLETLERILTISFAYVQK